MPFFSVIVPCYNAEKYLSEAVESVLSQSFSDWELLLVDDGSTDGTLKIINEYSERDRRIKPICKANGGVSSARNVGLQNAEGEWILFLDSDDWFEPQAFERIRILIVDSDADIVGFNHFYNSQTREWKRENFKPANISRAGADMKYFMLDTLFPYYDKKKNGVSTGAIRGVWGKAFKRRLIESNNVRFDCDIKIGEDAIFCLDAFRWAAKVVLHDEYLIHYRVLDSSTMNKYNAEVLSINERALGGYYSRIRQFIDSGEREFKICFCGLAAECLFRIFRMYLLHPDCTLSFAEKRRTIRHVLRQDIYRTALDCTLDYLPRGKKEMVFCAKHRLINILFLVAYISCTIIRWKKK